MYHGRIKYEIIFILIFFFGIFGLAKSSWAACVGTSHYDCVPCTQGETGYCRQPKDLTFPRVNAALSDSSDGDGIYLIAGTSPPWTSSLSIDKAIGIIGTGSSTTKLVADNTLNWGIFRISMTTTLPVRVSGIYFDLGTMTQTDRYGVYIGGSITKLRIDHNYFYGGKYQILTPNYSWIRGVIDSNTFHNSNASFGLQGDPAAWERPIVAGMAMGQDTLYVEGNYFLRDNTIPCGSINNHIESGQGGNFVIRYNTFDGSNFCYYECVVNDTGGCYTDAAIMTHGNGCYYQDGSGNGGALRGHPITEFYNNKETHVRNDYALVFRGGSVLAHDNAITTLRYNPTIFLREEEAVGDGGGWGLRTAWPAEDQINNSFFWNNTVNGSAMNVSATPIFIMQDRDYFMHAPCGASDTQDAYGNTCTHGKETYIGRPGASPTYPSDGTLYPLGAGTMTFISSGPNAYYPYTPYTCPHPLTGYTGIVRCKRSWDRRL